jgi:hypothetical protein
VSSPFGLLIQWARSGQLDPAPKQASEVAGETVAAAEPEPEVDPAEIEADLAVTTFEADLHGLKGTALFLDLDVVIVGDITPFFEAPGEFLIIHDWKRPWRITGNSSVYRFQIGAHADVLAEFRATQEQVRSRLRNEQAFLSEVMHRQGRLAYWPADWCSSFKYHCIPRWPTSYWREPNFPQGTRIVIFHGEVNPPDALEGRRNRRFRHIQPARWVAEHWRE